MERGIVDVGRPGAAVGIEIGDRRGASDFFERKFGRTAITDRREGIAVVDRVAGHDPAGLQLRISLLGQARPDIRSVIERVAAIGKLIVDRDVFGGAIDVEAHPVGVVAVRREHRVDNVRIFAGDFGEAR